VRFKHLHEQKKGLYLGAVEVENELEEDSEAHDEIYRVVDAKLYAVVAKTCVREGGESC
jgi:hypothetical protein